MMRSILRSLLPGGVLVLWSSSASGNEAALSQFARGVLAELDGASEAARGFYQQALQTDPDAFEIARKISELQLADDDSGQAARTLREFVKAHPGQLAPHLYYADFLEQQAPRDAVARSAATEALEAAHARFPHRAAIFSRLINLYENAGERERSLEVFEAECAAEGVGPDHWTTLAPIATTLLPGGSPELEERLDLIMAKLVETGAGVPSAARRASDYYRQTNRPAEAIEVLRKHVEIQPDSLFLRTRMGLLQLSAGQTEAGLTTLRETIQIDPDQVLAHRALAQYLARNGMPEEALHHNSEALRVTGGHPAEYLDLAEQYLELEKPHPARLLLEKARFEHPNHAGLASRLAIATLRDGHPADAARLFREAESLAKESGDPADADFLDADFQLEFAASLQSAGDAENAEARLRSAIRSIPPDEPAKSARALRSLAKLWIEQGRNLSPALSLLRRADSLEPDHPETKALLERAGSGQ